MCAARNPGGYTSYNDGFSNPYDGDFSVLGLFQALNAIVQNNINCTSITTITAQIANLIINALQTQSIILTPSLDGIIFTINNKGSTNQLTFDTSQNLLNLTGTASIPTINTTTINGTGSITIPNVHSTYLTVDTLINATNLIGTGYITIPNVNCTTITTNMINGSNAVFTAQTDGVILNLQNKASTTQITHNSASNVFSSTGTIQSVNTSTQNLTLQPIVNGQILNVSNASGISISSNDSNKSIFNFLTNYFFSSNSVFPNSSNIAFNYFSDSSGNDNFPNSSLGSSLINLGNNQISLFTGNAGTRPSTGLVFNGSNLFPTNTNQVNLGLTSNSFGTVNCARVAAWNSISCPSIAGTNMSAQNLSIKPNSDGQILNVSNAAGTNQINHNTSTNTLTGTGTLIFNAAQIANLILNVLTTKGLTISPSVDGVVLSINNVVGTTLGNFNTSTNTLTLSGIATIPTISTINITGSGSITIPNVICSNLTCNTGINSVSGIFNNLTVKPNGTDGQVLNVSNVAGTNQINHNTATNTFTGTGSLIFPTIQGNITGSTASHQSLNLQPSSDGVCFTVKDASTYHNTLLTFDSSKNQLGLPKDYASIFLCTGNSYGYLWTNYFGPGDVFNLSFNYYMSSPVNGGTATPVIPDNGYAPSMISLSNGTITFQIAPAINVAPVPVCSISSNTLFPASSGSFNIGSSSTPLGSVYSNNINATSLNASTSTLTTSLTAPSITASTSLIAPNITSSSTISGNIINSSTSINANAISISGNLYPASNNTSNLGLSTNAFNNGYITTATIGSITAQNGNYLMVNSGDLVMGMNGSSACYNVRPAHSTYGSCGTSGNPWGTSYGVQWANPSDKNLKQKIKRNNLGLDFINKISTVSYNYNYKLHTGEDNEKVNKKRRYGVIAQELEELLKKEQIESSFISKPENDDEFYGVDYTQFITPLIKAVQELTLKVERLEQELGRKRPTLEELGGYASGSNHNSSDEFETIDFDD